MNLLILDPSARCAEPKPRRGDTTLARTSQKRSRKLAEEKVMAAAKRRDGGKCRWPRCECASTTIPIDAVHFLQHRGAGGNPKGDRTAHTGQIIALCRRHHDMLDKYQDIAIEPIDATALADGPLVFYRRVASGRFAHVATETYRGISVTKGR